MVRVPIKALIIHSGGLKHLAGCLTSLRNVVTETIVCLNNDRAYESEIKRALRSHRDYYTGRVEWIGKADNFFELRNRALEYAEVGEYILQIDSDERVVGDLRGVVLEADGYRIEVMSPHIQRGNFIHIQREHVFRLFKYFTGVSYIFLAHEQISWNYIDKRVENLNLIKIKHLGYDISIDEMTTKVWRNMQLIQQEIEEFGEHSYMLYHLGECYLWFQERDKAVKCFERALERGEILNEKLNLEIQKKVNLIKKGAKHNGAKEGR